MKNCSFINKPIVIFRGDDTSAFNLRSIKIILKGDLDLSNAIAKFTLLDYRKEWTVQEVASGELTMSFTSADTKAMPLGEQTGTFRLYDMSTGEPRQLTVVNKIPFLVTNRVCELDDESYHADVSVVSGEIISIEFNVGVGAVNGKADKVKNAVEGDLAGLDDEGNLTDSGIPASDVLRKSQMDDTPTAGSLNPVTSDGIKQAIDAATPSDYEQVKAQVEANAQDIANIDDVIPSQATENNQLADKAFVNSSIATNTATFRGTYNLVADLSLTISATHEQVAAAIATKLAALSIMPENNDYCFVQVPRTNAEPTIIDRIDRYKCTVADGVSSWDYEWSLNNSSFTAEQWAAINSGITSALVAKLGALPTAQELATALLAKYQKPSTGIPKTDLSAGVQASLDKADTALQKTGGEMTGQLRINQDISGFPPVPIKETGLLVRLVQPYGYIASTVYSAGQIALLDGNNATVANLTLPTTSGALALLSDIYTAIQQIAPDFTAQAYEVNDLCTYNGAVYRCILGYTATSSSATPDNDTTHWEAKKVSELFLSLTGGTLSGALFYKDRLGIGTIMGNPALFIRAAEGTDFVVFSQANIRLGGNTLDYPLSSGTLALLENIAPAFSASATYEVNKLCVYANALYRCTTAITTGGEWDSSKWTAATVQDVLAAIWTALGNKAPLASPAFTGTPTAPTPSAGDDSTKVATTAFVKTAVAGATPNLDYVMRVDPETGGIYYTTPDTNA